MFRALLHSFALVFFAAFAAPAQAQMPDQGDINWAWSSFLAGDHGEALDILQRAAEAGDAPSQSMIGWAHETGKGVPEDTQQAIYWYQAAAIQDYGDAYSSLGLMYYYGRSDLPQDYALAEAYYEAGMALNDPESFSFLGYMYQEGHGVAQDYARAAELYERSARLGEGYGASQYGYLLREGLGIPQDAAMARDYYQIAIDNGYEYALADLAHMLHRGIGGPFDLDRALQLYIEAIENGVPYGGIGGSYLILENPDQYPDPIMGLSLCFWAVDNADPSDVVEYQDDCNYWADNFVPSDIARARQMAANY